MVERLVYTEDVGSSSLSSPTILFRTSPLIPVCVPAAKFFVIVDVTSDDRLFVAERKSMAPKRQLSDIAILAWLAVFFARLASATFGDPLRFSFEPGKRIRGLRPADTPPTFDTAKLRYKGTNAASSFSSPPKNSGIFGGRDGNSALWCRPSSKPRRLRI